jgi:hypothetical protein
LTIAAWRAFSASSAAPEFFDFMTAGLRKAGVPEE